MATASASLTQTSSGIAQTLNALRACQALRLDDAEISALAAALDGVSAFSIELFGSRTDSAARGGDIDILILSDAPRLATARRVSSRFFMHIRATQRFANNRAQRSSPGNDSWACPDGGQSGRCPIA